MTIPTLLYGRRDDGMVVEAERGWDDAGATYNMRVRTGRIAPAGVRGEAIFFVLYVATIHTTAAHLVLTPIIDNVAQAERRLALAAASEEVHLVHEVSLSVPLLINGQERGRQSPRGTWIEVLVTTEYDDVTVPAATQVVEGIELEYDTVREGRREAASP